jgi:ribonuclease HII
VVYTRYVAKAIKNKSYTYVVGIDEVGRAVTRRASSYKYLVGIDEVGRGPLAGPMTVAAVAMRIDAKKAQQVLVGIRDSKKLSATRREEWAKKIKKHSHFIYACVSISPRIIDERGMRYAGRHAVQKCLQKLRLKSIYAHVMLDAGLRAPDEYSQESLIKGDERVPLIAAASIIAKVTRDGYMKRISRKNPQYGFDAHKGYGTKAHIAAIRAYGLSDLHRKSFCTRIFAQ